MATATVVGMNVELEGDATLARFGSFMLCSKDSFGDDGTMYELASALESDPKVKGVQCPWGFEGNRCYVRTIYPTVAEPERLIDGADALHGGQFESFLEFEVQVKNQLGQSRTYEVIWDGWLAVVSWQSSEEEPFGYQDGQVVIEVLERAAREVGLELRTQGCDPHCAHNFSHTNVRFVHDLAEREELQYRVGEALFEVEARTSRSEHNELTLPLFLDLRIMVNNFTEMKNVGHRLLECEADARATLSELVGVGYMRAQIEALSPLARQRARWRERGWQRRARLLIARMWMSLARIEELRRQRAALRSGYKASAKERRRLELLEGEDESDAERLRSLDLEMMRCGVQEMAERLDNRAMLRATALAAVVGALAGGTIAAAGAAL